jgi:hypothetical protein
MKAIKRINVWLILLIGLTLLPTIWVASRPLKQKTEKINVEHTRHMASYMKANDCARVGKWFIEGSPLYKCKNGDYTFNEISVYVWKENL